MAKKYLDDNGLLYFWQKIKAIFVSDVTYDSSTKKIQKTKNGSTTDVVTLSTVAISGSYNDLSNQPTIPAGVEKSTTTPLMDGTASVGSETKFAAGDHIHPHDSTKVDVVSGKGLSTNDYTTAEKNKLAGIASGAEVNQNAFSNVKVGSTTVAADSKTDTLELVAGTDISITPDATNDTVTIAFDGTIPSPGTGSSYPVMDGTRALGSQTGYARVDHVHPSDTSRVPTTRTVNGKALSSNITLDSGDISFSWNADQEIGTQPTTVEEALNDIDVWAFSIGQSVANKLSYTEKGVANGVCPLNASSKIDSTYLPSYVDDVIEAYPRSGATELSSTWLSLTSGGSALTPEAGKIYVLMADSTNYSANSQFRWSGTTYVKLSDGGVSSITNSEIDTIVAS